MKDTDRNEIDAMLRCHTYAEDHNKAGFALFDCPGCKHKTISITVRRENGTYTSYCYSGQGVEVPIMEDNKLCLVCGKSFRLDKSEHWNEVTE